MNGRVLIKGNEAVVHGALAAGIRCYFGYPITPQNEISELFSSLLPERAGQFVQAESEVAAVNMLLGAGACGVRAMVSSSSPGISLMQEGISYMAGSELPGVIVNMARGGPGLGDIGPSQGDYFQATRGGGHGDYRTLVLAPSTCQECHDMTVAAFDLAFRYRNPVLILGDAMVGQMKEPVVCRPPAPACAPGAPVEGDRAEEWRLDGNAGRASRLLKSVWLNDNALMGRVRLLAAKYESMRREAAAELTHTDDAALVLVAFGSLGRIARALTIRLRREGRALGLVRPQTLYPFPGGVLRELAGQGKRFLVLEQNTGQMVEDVLLAVQGAARVDWFGVMPGCFPGTDDVAEAVLQALDAV
jgi:2-oxoglutarate ferredoxin oxidoreductase subunit alpha